MGLLSALQHPSLRASALPGRHPRDPALVEYFGGGIATSSGAIVTPDTALQVAAVYACIKVLAESVGQLPLFLYKRTPDGRSREKDYDHPLYRLLHNQPNRYQTAFEFWEMLVGHLGLRGAAYAEKLATGGKGLSELMPLHPDRVRAFIAPDGHVAYEYRPQRGPSRIILHSEMFCLRGLGSEPLSPLSPVGLHRETVGLALTTQEFGAKMFANGAQLSGVLEHPDKLGDEAYKHLAKSWEARYSGAANAGKTAILEEGMKYSTIGMTAQDSQFLETRKYQRSEIASIFRVPPHMIGDLERATFSNIEHQGIDFVTHTLMPWLVRIEQTIWRDLLTERERGSYYAKFNPTALLRGDTQSRFAAYAQGRQWGWYCADDVRDLEDLNPIPDEKGKIYLQPSNMVPAGTVPTTPNAPQEGQDDSVTA